MNQLSELEAHWERIYRHQSRDFRASSLNVLIASMIKPSRVLDIGCGTGGLSLHLLKEGFEVTAQDVSPEMVERCKLFLEQEGFPGAPVRQAGVEELSEQNHFDSVVALDVIEHIEDDHRAVKQMYKALKPGGRLVLSVPALQYLYGPKDEQLGHYRRYGKQQLRQVIEQADFRIESLRFWNAVGLLPVFVANRVLRKKISEEFRYKSESAKANLVNNLLKFWLMRVENHLAPPLGLTLIVQAEKPS
jgi:2-polyprenyl-3-methyl-5-hydroxy-6-metoxy-1,4-benzoquinol methylase